MTDALVGRQPSGSFASRQTIGVMRRSLTAAPTRALTGISDAPTQDRSVRLESLSGHFDAGFVSRQGRAVRLPREVPWIGDWGVGGIEIAIDRLTVYIAAAGIHLAGSSRWC